MDKLISQETTIKVLQQAVTNLKGFEPVVILALQEEIEKAVHQIPSVQSVLVGSGRKVIDAQSLVDGLQDILNDDTCPIHVAAEIEQYIDHEPAVVITTETAPVSWWLDVEKSPHCSHCGFPTNPLNRILPKYCGGCGGFMANHNME